jgi:hypothetical protein
MPWFPIFRNLARGALSRNFSDEPIPHNHETALPRSASIGRFVGWLAAYASTIPGGRSNVDLNLETRTRRQD